MKIHLPTGGVLAAPSDPTQAAPSDCSCAFSLMPLIASYLASTECVRKMLALVPPLVTIVKALDRTSDIVPFLQAGDQLAPCEFDAASAGMLTFLRDVICVAMAAVNCVIDQLQRVVDVMTNLAAQLTSAQATGNADLIAALQSEQKILESRLLYLFSSTDGIDSVLELAGPLLASSGFQVLQLPSAPPDADLQSATLWLGSLKSSVAPLQTIAGTLGGCSD